MNHVVSLNITLNLNWRHAFNFDSENWTKTAAKNLGAILVILVQPHTLYKVVAHINSINMDVLVLKQANRCLMVLRKLSGKFYDNTCVRSN